MNLNPITQLKLFAIFLLKSTIILAACIFSIYGCSEASAKKTFTIAYAPNESTEQSTDARNGLAKDLGMALGMEVKEI